ncbi:Proepiregulin [Tupaia chinensis]|uniref:Proepiregulin n=1 Tax=Tupaia chinensis TaxID=246437 RepID=L9L5N4_TUPCH|nr:Proepiregulin [Tupaia chinensis]
MDVRLAGRVPALLLCLGESSDNCTALVQMDDSPRVAQVSITKCDPDMVGYCLHGQCIYLVDMEENYCRCEVGYTGVRCEHFILTVHQPLSKEYVVLTVILTMLFLIIIAGSIYYFYRCPIRNVSPLGYSGAGICNYDQLEDMKKVEQKALSMLSLPSYGIQVDKEGSQGNENASSHSHCDLDVFLHHYYEEEQEVELMEEEKEERREKRRRGEEKKRKKKKKEE